MGRWDMNTFQRVSNETPISHQHLDIILLNVSAHDILELRASDMYFAVMGYVWVAKVRNDPGFVDKSDPKYEVHNGL